MIILQKGTENNSNWPQIPYETFKILIIGGLWSGKTNALFNLIKQGDDYSFIDKTYLNAKDLNKAQHRYLTRKCEKIGFENLEDPRLSLNLWLISRIFKKILKSKIQIENTVLIVFDD